VRKYLVSTTIDEGSWNNTVVIKGNVVEEIRKLKQQDGKDLLVYGSVQLIETLMAHDLVDRYRLLVYPVVLGEGKRLFTDGIKATLKLIESESFDSGVVALIYGRADQIG
jgi:dihydrofolate reductase